MLLRNPGDLCGLRLRSIWQIHHVRANGLIRALHSTRVIEEAGEDADRDALKQDDLQHLVVDRVSLQVQQLAEDGFRCLRLIQKVVMQVLHVGLSE